MTEERSAIPWVRMSAEFAVIVVGVLVALAVDQWASDRGDRRAEIEYLNALSVDLRADSALFSDLLIPILDRAHNALIEIGPVVRRQVALPSDTLAFLRQVVASTGDFMQLGVRTTFDELLSTGSLRLIESSSLRSTLASYYESKRLQENRSAMRASGYARVVGTYLPGDAFPSELDVEGVIPDSTIRSAGVDRALAGIRSQEFVGAMTRHLNYLSVLRPALARVDAVLQSLLVELTAELETRS